MADERTFLVDSLKAASFEGTKASRYGRRGHISGARSVPYGRVVDDAGLFVDEAAIVRAFDEAGVPLGKGSCKILAY